MRSFLISVLVFCIYRCLLWTWRRENHVPEEMRLALENKHPFIIAHWHGDELALLQFFSRYKIATIVSTSQDGALMDNVVRWMGGATTRGSSTRGGASALKGLFRLVRQGWNCSFAVDGPKGPIYKAKPGVFEISKRLKVPIYCVGVHCEKAFRFPRSWNQTYLPRPFAKVVYSWHGPWGPVSELAEAKDPHLAEELEKVLWTARESASKLFADTP